MVRLFARAALAALPLLVFLGATAPATQAQIAGLRFPAPAGTEWQVIAGYNTATHSQADGNDPYALDIVRTDGTTERTPVLSPITGEVGYIGDNCFSVRGGDVNILMCHVIADAGLERGEPVGVGQRLGYIAPPGQAGNNGYPHIHIALEQRGDEDWRDRDGARTRTPLPFTGDYRIEGVSFPRSAQANDHYLTRIVSTNDPSLSSVRVSAGADQTVDPGAAVTLVAGSEDGIDQFRWEQIEGPPVAFEAFAGDSIAFVAPAEPGAVLRFRVTASGALGSDADAVRVTVRGAPIALPGSSNGSPAITGDVPDRGIGLVVFSGGTTEQLVEVVACADALAVFATDGGRMISYIHGAGVDVVNERWNALFGAGLPSNAPLLIRCG